MAGRSSRSKGASRSKATGGAARRGKPTSAYAGSGVLRHRGRVEVIGGGALVILGLALALLSSGPGRYAMIYVPIGIGVLAIVVGAVRLSPPRTDPSIPPRPDVRRWIYGGLDVLFGAVYALVISEIIPNRMPSAAFHLWTLPACVLVMGAGTLLGGRHGWWTAIVAGSALLLSVIVMIVRILISAAFLAGVYGAFGKGAATFSIVAVALLVEVVVLLPIVQIKFLMTRAGRRAYGM